MSDVKAVVWDNAAIISLKFAVAYIRRDSFDNALKVRTGIVEATKMLAYFPTKYPPDRFKVDNDGSYRAFEKFKFRISYQVTDTEVRILHINHTKRAPQKY